MKFGNLEFAILGIWDLGILGSTEFGTFGKWDLVIFHFEIIAFWDLANLDLGNLDLCHLGSQEIWDLGTMGS